MFKRKYFAVKFTLKCWRPVAFTEFFVSLFAVNKCVHFVKVVSLVHLITTVSRPLSAGSITMLLSFFSRFSACCSAFVKLLSGIEVDCTVEAILLLMLSLADSDKSRRRDRTASTLDTMVSEQKPDQFD